MTLPKGRRADVFLVERGFAASRAEAQAAIEAGHVRVDGKAVAKPAQLIADTAEIEYAPAHPYVSRGALKLIAALDAFRLSPEGLVCLDIGASTGGFTEVLLERGAKKVYAIDVGHGQLRAKIASDPRVVSVERLNARELTDKHFVGLKPQAIVADVSFISLKLALPPALDMAEPGSWLIALVKPQFEVGKEHVGKGGIVRDGYWQAHAVMEIAQWLVHSRQWGLIGHMESPIEGGDGNREYLLSAKKP